MKSLTMVVLCLIFSFSLAYAGGIINNPASTQSSVISALTYTPEDVASKSTSTALGASVTLYPSQNAVKTYIDTRYSLPCYQHTSSSIYSAAGWTASPSSEVTFYSCSIPAGLMGANGVLEVTAQWSWVNGASTSKTAKFTVGATAYLFRTVTTSTFGQHKVIVRNRNSLSSQLGFSLTQPSPYVDVASGTSVTSAVDMSQAQTFAVKGQTNLEAGGATTAVVGVGGTCTATKAAHGLNTGEYIQSASGGTCPTSGNPNADPVIITVSDVNTFTFACSCVGTEAGVQPTVKRYSAVQLDSVDVEIKNP